MRSLELVLDPSPKAPGQVRRAVRVWLDQAHFEAAAHEVSLIVSELVTNAIVHARSAVRVNVTLVRKGLRIEVHDDDSRPPHVRSPAGPDGGFGLRIIANAAQSWGWRPTETGKVVWAELLF